MHLRPDARPAEVLPRVFRNGDEAAHGHRGRRVQKGELEPCFTYDPGVELMNEWCVEDHSGVFCVEIIIIFK